MQTSRTGKPLRPEIVRRIESGQIEQGEQKLSGDKRRRALVELLLEQRANPLLVRDEDFMRRLGEVNSAPEGALIAILLTAESTARYIKLNDNRAEVESEHVFEEPSHWVGGTHIWPLGDRTLFLASDEDGVTGYLLNPLNEKHHAVTNLMQWFQYVDQSTFENKEGGESKIAPGQAVVGWAVEIDGHPGNYL